MSWLYSQALVEEYLAANCLDGEQCAQLNVKPTPHLFWHKGKTTDFLSHSLFGPMSARLTENHGVELLTWFLADFLVRTSARLEREKELKESGLDSGWKWRESLVKYDPASCSWKTRQCSLLGDLELYSETWPKWGLMRDGECWERPTLAPPISARGSGLLPTLLRPNGGRSVKHVTDWRGNTAYHNGKKVQVDLKAAIQRLPTLTKSDGTGEPGCSGRQGGLNLRTAIRMLPTLTIHGNYNRKGASKNSGDGLATAVAMLPTLTSSMMTIGDMEQAKYAGNSEKRPSYKDANKNGGPLNPVWCEWFMGFPMGWTALAPLEMHKYQQWQKKHGNY